MNTPEQDMQDRAMSYSLDDEEVQAMEDALGRDPLDVLLADAQRMQKRKELHEDIAEYDRQARYFEGEMWRSMNRMRELKAHKTEAERQLQALGGQR
jgi:predicted  nucleic acid-binding Zn-ribbon protein